MELLGVIKHRGFLNLWINQILVQLSYHSLNFALIIWVFRLTDSSTAVSLLLLAVYLPAAIFGLLGGIIVDLSDRKNVILLINFMLSIAFFSLLFLKQYYFAILLVTFFINTLGQIYAPAEMSSIPLIVPKRQLLTANSLFFTTQNACFLLGFGLAGPLINLLNIDILFLIQTGLLTLAFILAFQFPSIMNKADTGGIRLKKAIKEKNYQVIKDAISNEIKETFKIIKGNVAVMASLGILSGVQMMIGVMAVLLPSFFEKTLKITATDASFILILPLGLGMVLGTYLLSRYGVKYPKRVIVSRGILTTGILFLLVGISPIVNPIIRYIHTKPLPFFSQPSHSTILVLGSIILGISLVSIIVPSQTVLQEYTPEQDRGKVFSVLAVFMSAFSLVPILLVGPLADLLGPAPLLIFLGTLIFLLGILSINPNLFLLKSYLPTRIQQFLGLGDRVV